ncbi:MAG: Xaa-Pro aminopeptidase [Sphingobacteriales bacterium]|nr:Xaa-Pro aminopeptidase [Sphingobacteriales bacterium]
MFEKDVYINRRKRLKEQLGSGLILLLGNEESSMNYTNNCYPFRQDSNFLYFFGLDRPGLTAIIDIDNAQEIIFGNDIDVEDIIWTGPLQSLNEQAELVGVSNVLPALSIADKISKPLSEKRKIHFLPPYRADNMRKLTHWLSIPFDLLKISSSTALIKAIVEQRSIKTTEEIIEIEKGVDITIDMQLEAARLAQEGISETNIAGIIHGIALSAGGNLAFPTILTVNGQILHNHSQGNILQKGQMLLCDCGAETSMHYGGDLTRTTPVDQRFSTRQKEIYDIVLHAHEAAIDSLRPGVFFKDVHLKACETLAAGLKSIGLMKGDTQEAVSLGAHAMFFQCGLGHMLGLDTHDMEDLGEEYVGYTDDLKKSTQFGLKSLRLGRKLEAGFVVTVEPGIYFIPELIDLWRSQNKFPEFINYDKLETYKDFSGIRIEEDLIITDAGSRILGKSLYRGTEKSEMQPAKNSL